MREGTQQFIDFLNELHALDPKWVQQMINFRPQCNEALATHPTVQAGKVGNDYFHAGLLGLINGFFGTQPASGYIVANIDENSHIQDFSFAGPETVKKIIPTDMTRIPIPQLPEPSVLPKRRSKKVQDAEKPSLEG
jgi:hypothetical protein